MKEAALEKSSDNLTVVVLVFKSLQTFYNDRVGLGPEVREVKIPKRYPVIKMEESEEKATLSS